MSHDTSLLPPEADAYLQSHLAPPYPALERIEKEVRAEGQPAVGRQTGAVLRALTAAGRAERALEVGTNLGYGALWICAGLGPQGRFEGIELDGALHARAQANLREAVGERARVHQGAALDVLPGLPDAAYDIIFLDAVKSEYPAYLGHALRLLRTGGIVAADNMFWLGQVWDEKQQDADTQGVREYTRRVFTHPHLTSAILPVEDGLAVSVLRKT